MSLHCTVQGELIWDKANACIPIWAWVSDPKSLLIREFIKNINQVEIKFGLVMA